MLHLQRQFIRLWWIGFRALTSPMRSVLRILHWNRIFLGDTRSSIKRTWRLCMNANGSLRWLGSGYYHDSEISDIRQQAEVQVSDEKSVSTRSFSTITTRMKSNSSSEYGENLICRTTYQTNSGTGSWSTSPWWICPVYFQPATMWEGLIYIKANNATMQDRHRQRMAITKKNWKIWSRQTTTTRSSAIILIPSLFLSAIRLMMVDGVPNRHGVSHSWYHSYPSKKLLWMLFCLPTS